MDYGIKVSEDGFDVNTADDKNLSLKTGFTLLKVYDQNNINVSNSDFGNTVSHALGYIPQYLVFVGDPAYFSGSVSLAKGFFGALELPEAIAKMNTTTLSIYKTNANQTAFYYIFYEPVDTGTAPSIVSTNNYGIKVSKDGFDVKTANILQQTFNSEKNSLKILSEDVSTSTASGYREVNIAHGLTFIPGFLVFYEVDNSGYWLFDGTNEDLSGKGVVVDCRSDSTNLVVGIYSGSSAIVKIHYYILADPGVSV